MSLAMLFPDADEMFANAGFEALMWALARPGSVQTLPAPGFSALVAGLIDRECTFHATDIALSAPLLATGAKPAGLDAADYVFADLGAENGVAAMQHLKQGNLLYPDESATLVAAARLGEGQRLRLSGPGIDASAEISVGGVDPGFWPLRQAILRYPLGFDLYLVDGDRVLGIPRSTKVEVM